MSRFVSRDLMIAVLPEDFGAELAAGPKTCGTGSCTNPSSKGKPALAAEADLARLRDQLHSTAD